AAALAIFGVGSLTPAGLGVVPVAASRRGGGPFGFGSAMVPAPNATSLGSTESGSIDSGGSDSGTRLMGGASSSSSVPSVSVLMIGPPEPTPNPTPVPRKPPV